MTQYHRKPSLFSRWYFWLLLVTVGKLLAYTPREQLENPILGFAFLLLALYLLFLMGRSVWRHFTY